jgi:flagellar L-ring protein precursor FlgH
MNNRKLSNLFAGLVLAWFALGVQAQDSDKSASVAAPTATATPTSAASSNAASKASDTAKNGKAPAAKVAKDLRADYLRRLNEQYMAPAEPRTLGSLWSAENALGDLASDDKARNINDMIVVNVSVQTTAAQSGNVDSERTFTTSSGITSLPGALKTTGVSSLLGANSSTVLKGQGSTASNTAFTTALTGQVIAVLANGNLVIEAERKISMNNQTEDLIIRGIVRPTDISPSNTIASSQLSNLEIEMKGKGVISNGTRPINPIMRGILWLFGF